MPVRVVTDSSAGLSPEVAAELDITVVDLHVMRDAGDGEEKSEQLSTSGLSAIELAAVYARQLERGGDDGLVVLHLSKRLSSTWSAAVSASAVFDDMVRVIDTDAAGMAVGAAAVAAASFARAGADVDGCAEAAKGALALSETWLYLQQWDDIRKSGRISTTTAVLSAALLATKPLLKLHEGKLELATRTRTQKKAFAKLVDHVVDRAGGMPVYAAVQHSNDAESAVTLQELLMGALPEGSAVTVHPLADAVSIHTGDGAIALSVVFATPSFD